ncbi:acetate--CoA ligase family protein [Xanthobacter flavus]|uniref:acetate--CoA ligase family protein n=1 Tax=Xanthobacter flavus TaxID=281 RepID=UPI001AE1DB5A|nr:acetate--CoA ligase family protein [Xanthobacter flavus]MBP2151139.1 acyl-CoA synthetase (NDP forming) [Xanthobacter flavus]
MNMPFIPATDAKRTKGLDRLLNAKSVAIVGMSSKPQSAGHIVLRNLRENGFPGAIHLVGRTPGVIDGLTVLTDMAELPAGVDLAVLTVPASSVEATLDACMARDVGAAIVFASGFAETGEEGRREQERIGARVRAGGMVVVGPNCLGFTNYAAGFSITFVGVNKVPAMPEGTRDAVAIVSQSGGLANHLRHGLNSRGVAVAYNISTGNEMDLGLGDFVDHLVDDAATRVIMIYAEDIRRPDLFLAAAARAHAVGKPLVMLFPGRSPRAQEAAKSHTGALAGDYAVMKAMVERAGVHLVETLDEFMDVAEVLSRYPAPSRGGLGILTFSGAFCGIAHDFCADIGVEIPALSAATESELKSLLPAFISPKNPIDLGTEAVWRPELVGAGVAALLKEPAIGAVAISIPIVSPAHAKAYVEQVVKARGDSVKPVAMAMLGDQLPLPPEFVEIARAGKVIVSRSSDRVLKALARIVRQPDVTTPAPATRSSTPLRDLPKGTLPKGTLPEWLGKSVLEAEGIRIPGGRLVRTLDEALSAAEGIGYPVVIKAQAGALAHKTEAGGVILNLADADALAAAWSTLNANIARAQPGLVLDGVLVEKMSAKGLELVVGGRRDPRWGPVVLIGLGGIMVEALGDVRLVAADASRAEFVAEFGRLKASKMLYGFRNLPPVDVEAAADVAVAIGRLLQATPEITDVEINPLMVYERGRGAVALDALIVSTGS